MKILVEKISNSVVVTSNEIELLNGNYIFNDSSFSSENFILIEQDVSEEDDLKNMVYIDGAFVLKPVEPQEVIDTIVSDEEIDTALKKAKLEKITLSNTMLEKHLSENPLFSDCHGGKLGCYTVTKSKQTELANVFLVHSLAKQAGVPDTLMWNESGESCVEWAEEELTVLALQIKAYVAPVVAHQRHLETQINACITLDDVAKIEVSYDDFKIA